MVDLIGVAAILAGLVLLFAGAALSVYGVAVLGAIVGGGVAYLFAPTVGGAIGLEGTLAAVAATAIGGLIGIVAAYVLLSMAVAALSFVAGTYAGLIVAPVVLGEGAGAVLYVAALVVGAVAAVLGSVLTRTVLVVVTSFVGATLASGSLTVAAVADAAEGLAVDPLLFEVSSPVFLGLFVLGVLTQLGLFRLGYVTRLVGVLPGASEIRDRRRRGGKSGESGR